MKLPFLRFNCTFIFLLFCKKRGGVGKYRLDILRLSYLYFLSSFLDCGSFHASYHFCLLLQEFLFLFLFFCFIIFKIFCHVSDKISEKFSTSESVSVVSLLDTPLCRRNKDSNLFSTTLDLIDSLKVSFRLSSHTKDLLWGVNLIESFEFRVY